MKNLILSFFLFSTCLLSAQSADSIAIKEINRCINAAIALTNQGDFNKALEMNDLAQKAALDARGKESSAYASVCYNRGWVNALSGNYAEAEKWHLESRDIRARVLGMEHADYASSLNNLANIYKEMGHFEKSQPLYLETIAIRAKILGKEHVNYANSLNSLANLYAAMGIYEKAEPLYLEAKAIREKVVGKEHPHYANSLMLLALLYHEIGDYEKAEKLYLESNAVIEKVLGKDHRDYAINLNNMATLYTEMGNYEKSETLFIEAKAIKEKTLGVKHPEYASSLNNLAIVYFYMGKFDKSEPLYFESNAILKEALGVDHPDYASGLCNLANFYAQTGNYEKSESLHLESKAILDKAVGKEHPNYVSTLNSLALTYSMMGKDENAELLFLESKEICEKVLGKEHPVYAQSLTGLSSLYQKMDKYDKAEPYYLELASFNQAQISKALQHLSEKELNQYLNTFSKSHDMLLSAAQHHNTEKLVSACFDNNLFYKGFLLSAANQVKRLALSDSLTTEQFNLLKSYQRRLSDLYTLPILERDDTNIAELENKSNNLEKELTKRTSGYGEMMRQFNWRDVQNKLSPEEVVIDFVCYQYHDPIATDSMMYAALLIKPGAKQPEYIPLFEQRSLDVVLYANTERKSDYVNSVYDLSNRAMAAAETDRKSLYELIWQPIEKNLVGIKTIYFSPSGSLFRINIDAIPVSDTETLADRYQLIQLNSARQLVLQTTLKNVTNEAVLFGGIQFERDSIVENIEPSIALRSRGVATFNAVDIDLRGGSWNFLPGTAREVDALENILRNSGVNVDLKKGNLATEESFKNIGAFDKRSPRILHIATHGYFFPDPKNQVPSSGMSFNDEPVFKISEHSMLRSGLILAGGNAAWHGQQTRDGREDGVLTAYEISQMNLSNTELVVLSACETGLGDIIGNEGVYGLQRAFKIAGAKYIIMSLWQVPDKQTSLLMTTFYKKWLEEKMTIPEAFHAAQKQLRDAGLDAYQWAGFVLVE